jgi:hypothetical protein
VSSTLTYASEPLTYGGSALVWGGVTLQTGLGPLVNSHEADDLEAQFKAALMEVFETAFREKIARINTYGMPHRGDFTVIERFVKQAGLALERRTSREDFMREMFRGWTANNPKRGLHFLRFYLRLMWPGSWTLTQLWHNPAKPYPTGLSDVQRPGYYLTSRVRLFLEVAGDIDGSELSKVVGSLRAVMPARMVLDASTSSAFDAGLRAAAVVDDGWDSEDWTLAAST